MYTLSFKDHTIEFSEFHFVDRALWVIIHSRRFASNVVTIVGTSEVLAVVLSLKLHVKKIIYFYAVFSGDGLNSKKAVLFIT